MQSSGQVIFEVKHCSQCHKHLSHHRGEDENIFLQYTDQVIRTIAGILCELAYDCDHVAFHINHRAVKFSELNIDRHDAEGDTATISEPRNDRKVRGGSARRGFRKTLSKELLTASGEEGKDDVLKRIQRYRKNNNDDADTGFASCLPSPYALPRLLEPRRPDAPGGRRRPIFTQAAPVEPVPTVPGRIGMFEVTAFDIAGSLSHTIFSKMRSHKFPEPNCPVLLSALLSFLMAVAERRDQRDLSGRISDLAVELGDLQLKPLRPLKRPKSARNGKRPSSGNGRRPPSARPPEMDTTLVKSNVIVPETSSQAPCLSEMPLAKEDEGRMRAANVDADANSETLRWQLQDAEKESQRWKSQHDTVDKRLASVEKEVEHWKSQHVAADKRSAEIAVSMVERKQIQTVQIQSVIQECEQWRVKHGQAQDRMAKAEVAFAQSRAQHASQLQLALKNAEELKARHADAERRLADVGAAMVESINDHTSQLQIAEGKTAEMKLQCEDMAKKLSLVDSTIAAEVKTAEGKAEEEFRLKLSGVESQLSTANSRVKLLEERCKVAERSSKNREMELTEEPFMIQFGGMLNRLLNALHGETSKTLVENLKSEDVTRASNAISVLGQVFGLSLNAHASNMRVGDVADIVDQSMDAAVELILDLEFECVQRDRSAFQEALHKDLKDGMAVAEDSIDIKDLIPGSKSVIIDFHIKDATYETCNALHDVCAGKTTFSPFPSLARALGQPAQVISYAVQSVSLDSATEDPLARRCVFKFEADEWKKHAVRSQELLNQITIPVVPEIPQQLLNQITDGHHVSALTIPPKGQQDGVFSSSSSVCTGESTYTDLLDMAASETLSKVIISADTAVFGKESVSHSQPIGETLPEMLRHIDGREVVEVEEGSEIARSGSIDNNLIPDIGQLVSIVNFEDNQGTTDDQPDCVMELQLTQEEEEKAQALARELARVVLPNASNRNGSVTIVEESPEEETAKDMARDVVSIDSLGQLCDESDKLGKVSLMQSRPDCIDDTIVMVCLDTLGNESEIANELIHDTASVERANGFGNGREAVSEIPRNALSLLQPPLESKTEVASSIVSVEAFDAACFDMNGCANSVIDVLVPLTTQLMKDISKEDQQSIVDTESFASNAQAQMHHALIANAVLAPAIERSTSAASSLGSMDALRTSFSDVARNSFVPVAAQLLNDIEKMEQTRTSPLKDGDAMNKQNKVEDVLESCGNNFQVLMQTSVPLEKTAVVEDIEKSNAKPCKALGQVSVSEQAAEPLAEVHEALIDDCSDGALLDVGQVVDELLDGNEHFDKPVVASETRDGIALDYRESTFIETLHTFDTLEKVAADVVGITMYAGSLLAEAGENGLSCDRPLSLVETVSVASEIDISKPVGSVKLQDLSDDIVQRVRSTFDAIDIDNSGTIEVKEFKRVMSALEISLTDEECEVVFESFDVNKDSKLQFEEYLKLVKEGLSPIPKTIQDRRSP